MGHTGTLAINVSLYKKIPYDPARDFEPVSLVASSPLARVTLKTTAYSNGRMIPARRVIPSPGTRLSK